MPSRLLFAAALGLFLALMPPAIAQRPESAGIYTDGKGQQHPWTITPTHALLWEKQAYVPLGGAFCPRYLAEAATEENWTKDTTALALLKSKGALDLLINPVVSAADVPPAAWQRLVDYLEANGFRYGITFGAGVTVPLTGTVIKPGNYRVEDVRENTDVTFNVSDTDTARFLFADARDGTAILREGQAKAQNGAISLAADSRVQGAVGLLYPRKTLRGGRDGGLPDVWAGFDAYRDRLLTVFAAVKFGPGLRFFLDPLAPSLGIPGEAEYTVPDSPAFRLEWQTYLAQRYPTLDDLMVSWAVQDRDLKDYEEAARLIPLWSNRKGVPFVLDTTTGRRYEVRPLESRFWRDLSDFRGSSLQYYMNTAADLLKREVANVPVVYTRTFHHYIFTNPSRSGGFDGLGIAAYARGTALVTGGADSVYTQCEEAARPMWCLVTETLDAAAPAKQTPGYDSREALFYDLDSLRGIGAKGFFINGFQVLPEPAYTNCQLLRVPDQLDWLRDYGDRLHRELDLALSRPRVLPFPSNAAGLVHAGPIGSGGVWWVPSLAPGKPLAFGSSYAGYTIAMENGEATVLWSLRGPRETRLYVHHPQGVEVTSADGQPLTVKKDEKKGLITLEMDERPVVVRGAPDVFPIEAAEDAVRQLRALVAQGLEAKILVEDFRRQLDIAENNLKGKPSQAGLAFSMASEGLNGIISVLQPYTWREAELADSHTFGEVTLDEAASGGAYLNLNTQARPGREGYVARYKFDAPADDVYTVWLSCSLPGPQTSPFVWAVDSGQPHASGEGALRGAPYLSNRFQWLYLGRVALKKGTHSFSLSVTDAALARYNLALDALLITRNPFEPNGTTRPAIGSLTDKDVSLPAKRKK